MAIKIPFFPLKEIGRIVKREIRLEPNGEYKTVGCKLYGLGVYERETKGGSDIQAKRMFLIEENDFLINRIWAQKGSAGIVPPELEGAVVTNDFPVIKLDLTRVYPPYITWYVKTRNFWETCRKHSHGTSGRERLSPKELPNIKIPLPLLEEQKRIVARVESLMARIEVARRLRAEAVEELEALIKSLNSYIFERDSVIFEKENIGNLISLSSGENLTSGQMNDLMPYPVYGGGGLTGRYSSYMFEESKIVIGRVGARCGCVFVTEPKSWITGRLRMGRLLAPSHLRTVRESFPSYRSSIS